MNKRVKQDYIKDLEEMSNNELLFEFDFCCTEVERLMKLSNNDKFSYERLSGEMSRKRLCKDEILKRMGGNK